MNVLDIYVTKHCFGCDEAIRLANEIMPNSSGLQVTVRTLCRLTKSDHHEIIATPSYFLNGRLLFLGNPRLEELVDKIASRGRGGKDE